MFSTQVGSSTTPGEPTCDAPLSDPVTPLCSDDGVLTKDATKDKGLKKNKKGKKKEGSGNEEEATMPFSHAYLRPETAQVLGTDCILCSR